MTKQRGETHASARLNPDKVRAIRRRLAGGDNYPTLARKFGVSIVTIHHIKTRKTWKHVEQEEA